jgi:Rhodopirellula transposase DDE domain
MSTTVEILKEKFEALHPLLHERALRRWAAVEAQALGWGGGTRVASATGLSRATIQAGIAELQGKQPAAERQCLAGRVRRPGAGRKRLEDQAPAVLRDLEALVEPATRGDPQAPLRWTCKSTRKLADALQEKGYQLSERKVAALLKGLDYRLQANRQVREGTQPPDRHAQFDYINEQVKAFQARHQPIISVDTKTKAFVGDFKNSGRAWQPNGHPEEVRVHDFMDQDLGKAIPYGVYDVPDNEGWVSVGVDHETAAFAVASITRWWYHMGRVVYPKAEELLISADGGGSNGRRTRVWKRELQQLANDTGLKVAVSHFPPGTSQWNNIEHRMFAYITQNWRGKPLLTHEVIVNLIGSTTTRRGVRSKAELDTKT